ncbi:MAG: hypothetical protein ACREKS_21500 [Candidatus Rokuibacteriota bacterium]
MRACYAALRMQDPVAPYAKEHLTTAAALYREMDIRFWLEQAEAPR